MISLARFCADLEARLQPLKGPLDAFAAAVARVPADDSAACEAIGAAAAELEGLRGRLDALLAKAAAQQAYMIVFGPLKSGKSTLMNALAGAYVSEVSSLPAYPCMVFVGHGEGKSLEVSRYDGRSESFPDLDGMRGLLGAAHRELADELRAAEAAGRDLDPETDLPSAIRRIDVRMPAPPLAESGAMLVDTPGLYSRMKFGYDMMAREFRDQAASAIFVVKTDNLFLEQIYDEFTDLLRLFSRIFLVVNLDSTKRDLAPDGDLEPSLEQMDPARVVEAFENLSMNAELHRACDEGRLSIYPVDLLRAARRRLGAEGDSGGHQIDLPERDDGFARLENDVREYLNDDEFVRAFVRDTTRQADGVLEDLSGALRSGACADLSRRLAALEAEEGKARELATQAESLVGHDWERAIAAVRDDVRRLVAERTREIAPSALAATDQGVAAWFRTDASLADLLRKDIAGICRHARAQTVEVAADVSRTVVGSDVSGALVRAGVGDAARALDLPIAELARQALAEAPAPEGTLDLAPSLPTRLLPVRRSWLDWLLLRSSRSVRRHLFGPEAAPARTMDPAVKEKRLDGARPVLAEALRQRVTGFVEESLGRVVNEVFGRHVAAVCVALRAHLVERAADATARATQLAQERAALAGVGQQLLRLEEVLLATPPLPAPEIAAGEAASEVSGAREPH